MKRKERVHPCLVLFRNLCGALQKIDEASHRITLRMQSHLSITRRCAMTCERCDGLMVSERICDLRGMNSDLCVKEYRCILCGNVVDATILENRRRSTEAVGSIILTSLRLQRFAAA